MVRLTETPNLGRPPIRATQATQTQWNADLVRNLHDIIGRMTRKINAASASGAQIAKATTSVTAISFTGLAVGVSRIDIILDGVSVTGADQLLVRVSTGGTFDTTGYESISSKGTSSSTATNGFVINDDNGAAVLWTGIITLMRATGNTWVMTGNLTQDSGQISVSAGRNTLSGELDGVQLALTGTDTFDAGQFNIFVT